eukprot:7409474-Pyramimonas_sp.AAC.1
MLFKRTVGRKVGCLWKTGLLPSAAHGAGASGLTDEVLAKLRSTAGLLVGSRAGSSSLTLYMATQRSPEYDPMFAATCDLAVRYASWIREARTSMSRLHRAWVEVTHTLVNDPSRRYAKGPIGAVTLSSWRIGWAMHPPTVLITDEEEYVPLRTMSPKGARRLLCQ